MLWELHVDQVVNKLSRVTRLLYKNSDLLRTNTKLLIYYWLFLSYLNCCFLVWGPTTVTNIPTISRCKIKLFDLYPTLQQTSQLDLCSNSLV